MNSNRRERVHVARLEVLRLRHRVLNEEIDNLQRQLAVDGEKLVELKKEKLKLKDQIARLERRHATEPLLGQTLSAADIEAPPPSLVVSVVGDEGCCIPSPEQVLGEEAA
jgi:hypothetical protein